MVSGVRPDTIVTPYRVTRRAIYKKLVQSSRAIDCRDPKKVVAYMAKVFEDCIREVAVEAGKIMEFMRDSARMVAKANRGMALDNTVGFCVVHEIRETKPVRVATTITLS